MPPIAPVRCLCCRNHPKDGRLGLLVFPVLLPSTQGGFHRICEVRQVITNRMPQCQCYHNRVKTFPLGLGKDCLDLICSLACYSWPTNRAQMRTAHRKTTQPRFLEPLISRHAIDLNTYGTESHQEKTGRKTAVIGKRGRISLKFKSTCLGGAANKVLSTTKGGRFASPSSPKSLV